MAAKHEVEAKFTLKDEMSVQLEAIRKRAAALEKDAKALVGETGKVQGSFAELTKGLDKFSPGMGRALSSVHGLTAGLSPLAVGLGVTGAAVAALGGLAVLATKNLVAMGDRLTNLSRVTGISTDALQRMEAFGRPLGITLEQMTSASTKLEMSLGKGGEGVTGALKKLGFSMADLSRMDADTRLLTVAKALAALKSPLDQAAAGSALLGRAWADLRLDSASINEGTAAIQGTLVVSQEAADAGDALGDSWDQLAANAKALSAEAAQPVAEMLTTWTRLLNKAVLGWDLLFKAMAKPVKIDPNSLAGQFGTDTSSFGTRSLTDVARGGTSDTEFARQLAAQETAKQKAAEETAGFKRELTDEEQREIEKLQKLHEKAAAEQIKDIARLSEAHAKAAGEAWMFWDAAWDKIQKAALDADIESALQGFGPLGFSGGTGLDVGGRFAGMHLGGTAPGVDFSGLVEADKSAIDFGLSLEDAAHLTQIFGDQLGELGSSLIEGLAVGDLLKDTFQNLGLESEELKLAFAGAGAFLAAWGATETGSQGKRALSGAAAGAAAGGAIVPGWGHLIGAGVGALVGWLRGAGPAQVGEDAGRDIGVALSQALMEEIHKSGENAQLFLREIFSEGNLGIDRFAEEVGDLLSMFERGEISEGTLLEELKETIPILIENFEELGPAGQEQIERIIQAAREAGLEFEELGELIALTLDDEEVLAIVGQLGVTQAAADALGISFDQLGEKIESIFAPETLETLAENFGATTEEMRQILADLGVNVQTDLERLAASIGLTVEDFQELGAALEESTGGTIGAEELVEFLEQSGLSAEELAAALGVDVAGSLGSVNEEAAGAAGEISAGADQAARLADELGRAAFNASQISVTGFDTGTGIPDVSAAGGFDSPMLPRDLTIRAHRGEEIHIGQPGSGSGGMTINVNITGGTIIGSSKEFEIAVANAVREANRPTRNTSGFATSTRGR